MTSLLAGGLDPNHRDIYGETGLHLAVQNNCIQSLGILVEGKADVNSQNDRGSTPLHVAAQQSFDDCVKLLIDLGADPSLRNIKKQLPVEFCKKSSTKVVLAAATGRQPTQSEAVSSNKNPGEEFARLSLACMRGDRAIIRDLVENNRSFLTEKSSYGDTPFHIACSSGNAEIAQLRLELGADPKALNSRSKTGFEEAAISGFSNFP